jgi:hypothetical protein
VNLLSAVELDQARLRGDPVAAAVARDLGREIWTSQALLRQLQRNADALPPALPASVQRLFSEHVRLPAWFDEVRARRAARWAERHLPHITLSLFCASLPSAYAAARGARVLAATGRMQGDRLERRVNETAEFVLDVLSPGAFAPNGSGLCAIRKVRLLHAAVREELAHRPELDGEVPINQEDLLGTLFTFSVIVLQATRLLGAAQSETDAEDFYHLWRAVAVMLGVEERLVPTDLTSATATSRLIASRQLASSEHGRELFRALMLGMQQHVGQHVPSLAFAPQYLVRYLAGERVAQVLGLSETDGLHDALAVLRLLPQRSLAPLSGIGSTISMLVGRPLLQAVVAAKLKGQPASYSST